MTKLSLKHKLLTMLEVIFGFFKTIRFNFHYFPFKTAIHFPVLVSKNTSLSVLHGSVTVSGNISFGMIKIGFGTVGLFDHAKERTIFVNSSKGDLHFGGSARLGPGCRLLNNGNMSLGSNFCITGRSTIICQDSITIDKDVLLSWDILLMDTDYHSMVIDDNVKSKTAPVSIGKKVWIGARATILKGSEIPDNSVVGAAAVVSGKKITNEGFVLCGVPAQVIKTGVDWVR